MLFGVHPIDDDPVGGTGGTTTFSEQGYLQVLSTGLSLRSLLLSADARRLPRGCDAVFGVPAICDLGIDLSAQLELPDAPLQCFLQEVPDAPLESFLGEKSLREWLEVNEGASVDTKPFDLDAIEINPDLPPAIIARVKEIIRQYAAVFDSSSGNLPKPFDTDPVELNFRDDAQPQSIPEPRWTHATGIIIGKWGRMVLANGSLEHSKSAWASRPHMCTEGSFWSTS